MHDPDLGKAERQRWRRLDAGGQRLRLRRQRRFTDGADGQRPMGGRRGIGRCIEIVADGGPQGHLVSPVDADLVEDGWPEVAARTFEDFSQRADFRLDALALALRFKQRTATLGFLFAPGGKPCFRRLCGFLGSGQRG